MRDVHQCGGRHSRSAARTFNISAAPGCTWIASSNASWSPSRVPARKQAMARHYQIQRTRGAARTSNITLAGFSYTVEQASVSTTEMTSSGAMAQLARRATGRPPLRC